jgi:hypothetical protein
VLGAHTYSLVVDKATKLMIAYIDGSKVFRCTVGVRVVTSLDGSLLGLVGIATTPVDVVLTPAPAPAPALAPTLAPAPTTAKPMMASPHLSETVKPNEEWGLSYGHVNGGNEGELEAKLLRAAPFVTPFS